MHAIFIIIVIGHFRGYGIHANNKTNIGTGETGYHIIDPSSSVPQMPDLRVCICACVRFVKLLGHKLTGAVLSALHKYQLEKM